MKGMRDLIEKIQYEYKMGGNLKFVADSHLTLVIMNRIKFFSRKLPSFTSASRCEKFKKSIKTGGLLIAHWLIGCVSGGWT